MSPAGGCNQGAQMLRVDTCVVKGNKHANEQQQTCFHMSLKCILAPAPLILTYSLPLRASPFPASAMNASSSRASLLTVSFMGRGPPSGALTSQWPRALSSWMICLEWGGEERERKRVGAEGDACIACRGSMLSGGQGLEA